MERFPKELRAKQSFERFAEFMPHIVWIADCEGRPVFSNALGVQYFGAAVPDWSAVVHADESQLFTGAWDDAIRSCEPLTVETRLKSAAGIARWHRSSAMPVFDPATGQPAFWLGSSVDIDDTRRQAERLVAEHERFRTLLEAVPTMVWTATAGGDVDYVNSAFSEFFGRAPSADAWRWAGVLHHEDVVAFRAAFEAALETQSPLENESRLLSRSGHYRWFLIRAVPLHREGAAAQWFGTCTDVTEHHELIQRSQEVVEAFQRVLLPKQLPSDGPVAFDASYVAASEESVVGGDWYDAFRDLEGRLCVSIGDVVGHGAIAAVTMALVRQRFLTAALDGATPVEAMDKAHKLLVVRGADDLPSMATALFGIFDSAGETFEYANAGHPAPLLVRSDGSHAFLENGGLPLGSIDFPHPIRSVHLEPGDTLVLYTDGAIEESRNVETGEQRLVTAAAALHAKEGRVGAKELHRAVLGDAPPRDDVAILCITRSEVSDFGVTDDSQRCIAL